MICYVDIVSFYVSIGILSILSIYHLNLSRTFTGNAKEKLYYYNAHMITLTPIMLYIYTVIDMHMMDTCTTNFMKMFYIEWSITIPLTLINLGRMLNYPLEKQMYISMSGILIAISGYISYISENPVIIYVFYGIGCMCYIVLNCAFLFQLKTFRKRQRHTELPTSIYRDSIRYRIFRCIITMIVISWCIYPITHMLYKQDVLTLQTTVNIFVGMDIMTKGIFTNLLLGTHEVHRAPISMLGYLTKKVFRVHPLETNVSPHVLEELKERSQRTDEIVPVYQSDFSTTDVHYVPTMDTIYEKGEPKESRRSSVPMKSLSSVHSKSKRQSYTPEIVITYYSTTS